MPDKIHRDLDRRARKLGLKHGTDSYKRYVYGTIRKIEKRKRIKDYIEDFNFEMEDPPYE